MTATPPGPPARRPLCGIVLAAGRSARFGPDDKLLAPFDGHPLCAHAAGAMRQAPLDRRIVVLRDAAVAAAFEGFEIVHLSFDARSDAAAAQSDSLRAGIRAARSGTAGAVLVALADMPLVDADLLTRVARLGAGSPDGRAAARGDHGPMPPAYFAQAHFDALLALSGDRGAGALLQGLPDAALVAADGRLADIDRPEDLVRLSASRRGR